MLKQIIRYIQEIKDELADKVLERDKTGVIMREILFACDISIYAAASLLQDKCAYLARLRCRKRMQSFPLMNNIIAVCSGQKKAARFTLT